MQQILWRIYCEENRLWRACILLTFPSFDNKLTGRNLAYFIQGDAHCYLYIILSWISLTHYIYWNSYRTNYWNDDCDSLYSFWIKCLYILLTVFLLVSSEGPQSTLPRVRYTANPALVAFKTESNRLRISNPHP